MSEWLNELTLLREWTRTLGAHGETLKPSVVLLMTSYAILGKSPILSELLTCLEDEVG